MEITIPTRRKYLESRARAFKKKSVINHKVPADIVTCSHFPKHGKKNPLPRRRVYLGFCWQGDEVGGWGRGKT